MSETQHSTIQWEGRDIRLSYTPRYCDIIDHVEIRALDGGPLPITKTGYRSHYFDMSNEPRTMKAVETLVMEWLEAEAKRPAWKAHVDASRQGSLF